MLDSYIIINRKPKIIMFVFICLVIVYTLFILYSFLNYNYTSYYIEFGSIKYVAQDYYLQLEVDLDEINDIVSNSEIIFIQDNIMYNYDVYKIDEEIIDNRQVIYLKIYNLDNSYKLDNYGIEVKIEKESFLLIDY